ncbi:hypothetical protein PIB30_078313 [Stylosanthes scabra]|uniref:Uncharacterized protein n=1 Tax=Stylosanthes scabra TaxID=79078 RepID=A0ABU6SRH7_9FABA|nr:hypothetical protein [Stylosanthes scabra]
MGWWYNLLAQLVDSDDEEDEESKDESEEENEDESTEEDNDDEPSKEEEEESEDEEEAYNKGTSFIATLFNNKEIREEVPIKCEDPGPCLVTCRIKEVEVRDVCVTQEPVAAIVSVVGIAENILVRIRELVIPANFHVIKSTKGEKGGTPQVLLGRPFLKTAGFKLIYYDEIFTFEVGNVIEIFHLTPPPKPREKSLHQLQESKRKGSPKRKAKMRKTPRGRSNDEKGARDALTQSKGERKKISLNNEKRKKEKKKDPKKMARTKSGPLAKGKTKVHRPPLQASQRLATLRSRGEVQPQLPAPEIPEENILTPMLPPINA